MCPRLIGTFGPKSAPQTLSILLGLSKLIEVGNRTIVIVPDWERPIPTPAHLFGFGPNEVLTVRHLKAERC